VDGIVFGVAFTGVLETFELVPIFTPNLFGELEGFGTVAVDLVLTTLVVVVCD